MRLSPPRRSPGGNRSSRISSCGRDRNDFPMIFSSGEKRNSSDKTNWSRLVASPFFQPSHSRPWSRFGSCLLLSELLLPVISQVSRHQSTTEAHGGAIWVTEREEHRLLWSQRRHVDDGAWVNVRASEAGACSLGILRCHRCFPRLDGLRSAQEFLASEFLRIRLHINSVGAASHRSGAGRPSSFAASARKAFSASTCGAGRMGCACCHLTARSKHSFALAASPRW